MVQGYCNRNKSEAMHAWGASKVQRDRSKTIKHIIWDTTHMSGDTMSCRWSNTIHAHTLLASHKYMQGLHAHQ